MLHTGTNLDPARGVRRQPDRIQLGLTRSEIHAVEKRIRKLLKTVDGGKIGVF
jgi:hypothetical protein